MEAGPSRFTPEVVPRPNLLPLLDERLSEWNAHPTIGGAADLLAYDQFPELRPHLQKIAKYVLSSDQPLPIPLKEAAQRALEIPSLDSSDLVGPNSRRIEEIHTLRHRLALNPRNAVAYVDLARWYAALGRNEQALRLLNISKALEPNSRFVIRAIARFHIHANDPERALAVVNHAVALKEDPWLMASSVAISNLLGKSGRIAKYARTLVSSDTFHPSQVPELASALATLEMFSGSQKKARKLFNIALVQPNDNSVAQALWAADHLKTTIEVQDKWLDDPLSAEARYYRAFFGGNLEAALMASKEWFADEPFSSRPMTSASFICGLLENYEAMERCCRVGLVADPLNVGLRNNLAFSLSSQWRLEEAVEILRDLLQEEKDALSGHTLANLGQLMYREGFVEEGEMLYRKALDRLKVQGLSTSQALAMAYMAREALLANAENSEKLVAEAKGLAKEFPSTGVDVVLRSVTASPTNLEVPSKKILRDQKWRYDKERNLLLIEESRPFKE
ncbi:MAG TPA: hypothetical protein VKS43_15695 [Burkholderiales bacterium]|nr:hypothetical protein [Burkholderiales bacterium]